MPLVIISTASTDASSTMVMERSRRAALMRFLTESVIADGFTKMKAWFSLKSGVSSKGSPPSFCAFLSIGVIERPSNAAKREEREPSPRSTCGFLSHSPSRSLLIPARSSALAVSSSLYEVPSQLRRSATPSKGEALPCTALSAAVGFFSRPSPSQSCMICHRIEPTAASAGSSEPSTPERKSENESADESHCTEK